MPGHTADDDQAGGEAGHGLGAQPPPADAGIGATAVNTEYPGEFAGLPDDHSAAAQDIPDYSESGLTGGAAGGFGWLLGPFGHYDVPTEPPAEPPVDDFGDEAAMVRPYAWTRGRTRANYDLKLETLVSTTELGEDETLLPQLEHRAVSSLCRYPLSVAEVAAKLSIPLGVARVILSDMAELGLISIHRTFADDDIAAHLVLMERVLSGLRRL
jgi:hypothetical protein